MARIGVYSQKVKRLDMGLLGYASGDLASEWRNGRSTPICGFSKLALCVRYALGLLSTSVTSTLAIPELQLCNSIV